MTRGRKVGWILSVFVLAATGVVGLLNGIREMSLPLTPLQRSVSTGVLIYGLAGVTAGVALIARHRSSVWLATVWGVVVTYVASVAAIAYAGADATFGGAISSGVATALVAAAIIWSARLVTRREALPVERAD